MIDVSYTALVVEETGENRFERRIETLRTRDLPDHEVMIRVLYSSLNYKDALSATGNRGVTRRFPHTPGIDAAGIVADSRTERFRKGEKVIVTSYDLGMNTSGGFGQYIRVPADWVVRMPEGLDERQAMIFGTAGLTAGLSVDRLIHSVRPDQGEILVTGATGGVGGMAVAILSRLGYRVAALTGKSDTDYLVRLGADSVIRRQDFPRDTAIPVLKARWAGVIDTVGGDILSTAIRSTGQDGVVTCCGNVASAELHINVYPFILRGVSLAGIDSQHCPMPLRTRIWEALGREWKPDHLDAMAKEIDLSGLDSRIGRMLKGELRGRTLVNLSGA